MRCANCGAELKVGCVYCSVCGKEAQIVSDDSLLEDDFLKGLLKEKKQTLQKAKQGISSKKKGGQGTSAKKNQVPKPPSPKKSKQGAPASKKGRQGASQKKNAKQAPAGKKAKGKRKKPVWAFVMVGILILLLGGIALLVHDRQENSYEYQMKKAAEYQEQKEYGKAEQCLKRALELDSTSEEAKMRLAKLYVLQGQDADALKLLQELIQGTKNRKEAYGLLIQVYAKQEEYGILEEMGREITDKEISGLLSEYRADPPVFKPEGGNYKEELSVELTGGEGCEVYYTTNGSDPKKGKKYQQPIPLEPGKSTRIRAVSRNKFGVYGEETEERYLIELQKPDTPYVTPSGGSFYSPQAVTVKVPEGCQVYYTWDTIPPSEESPLSLYTEPISIPEGNNVLSLVLVDKYGMYSEVLKCNYIYIP